jgi:hypothetical protein
MLALAAVTAFTLIRAPRVVDNDDLALVMPVS